MAWAAPVRAAEPQPPVHELSDRAELDRVIDLYHSGQYESCKSQLDELLDKQAIDGLVERSVVERARLYLATCSLMLGDEASARAALRAALEKNPLMASPDSLTFPPPVVGLFLQVRDEVQALIARREQEEVERLKKANREARAREQAQRERDTRLLELASQETLVTQNNRLVAFLPFGAGQYQNGQRALGDFFLVTEAGVSIIAGASGLILLDLYRQTLEVEPAANDNSKFQAAYTVLAASSWTLATLVVLGMLEANLNYKESRVLGTRKRELPNLTPPLVPRAPSSRASAGPGLILQLGSSRFEALPFGAPLENGFQFGFVGRF